MASRLSVTKTRAEPFVRIERDILILDWGFWILDSAALTELTAFCFGPVLFKLNEESRTKTCFKSPTADLKPKIT
jgi:hypothetical protein